jgi:hypothetical protein
MGKIRGVQVRVIACTIYKLGKVAVPSRRTGFIPTTWSGQCRAIEEGGTTTKRGLVDRRLYVAGVDGALSIGACSVKAHAAKHVVCVVRVASVVISSASIFNSPPPPRPRRFSYMLTLSS